MIDFEFAYPLTGLAQIVIVILTFLFAFRTGFNRGKMGVPAPAMSGNPEWERLSRVHLNTVELAVIFIPSMWLAAIAYSDMWAAAAGALWIVGRLVYSSAYIKEPASRGPGMLIGLVALIATIVMALMAIIPAL